MENIRVLRMNDCDGNVYSTDMNNMVFDELPFIAHLACSHTDNYEIRCINVEDMVCIFPEASMEKINQIWGILTYVGDYSVVSNDMEKFDRYRLTIFNKIWEWCA